METEAKPGIRLTTEAVRAIEDVLHRRNQVEIKIEQGKIAVIEIKRKKVN
jgi:hypothetical protein